MKPNQTDMTQAALESLLEKHDGRISPAIVLDEARDQSSPLHDYFEWDDATAGEQYRLVQAAQLIRRWKGQIIKRKPESKELKIDVTRRVQSPSTDRAKGGASYQPIEEIMADPQKREAMIRTALKELAAIRRRFADLVALSDIWRAIDDAAELHLHEPKPPATDGTRPNA